MAKTRFAGSDFQASIGFNQSNYSPVPSSKQDASHLAQQIKNGVEDKLYIGPRDFQDAKVIYEKAKILKQNQSHDNLKIQGDDTSSKQNPANYHARPQTSPAAAKQTESVPLAPIFDALKENTKLKSLTIDQVDLSDKESLSALNRMLRDNSTLQTLALTHCSLKNQMHELTYLANNTGIKNLDLRGNELTDKDLTHLAMRLKATEGVDKVVNSKLNTSLVSLEIDNDPEQGKLASQLLEGVARQRTICLKQEIEASNHHNPGEPDNNNNQHPLQLQPAPSVPKISYVKSSLVGTGAGTLLGSTIALGLSFLVIASGPAGWAALGAIVLGSALIGCLGFNIAAREKNANAAKNQPTVSINDSQSSNARLHQALPQSKKRSKPEKAKGQKKSPVQNDTQAGKKYSLNAHKKGKGHQSESIPQKVKLK